MGFRSVLFGGLIVILCGACENRSKELEKQVKALINQLQSARSEASECQAKLKNAQKELATLKQTPDALFRSSVDAFSKWKNESSKKNLFEAEKGFNDLLEKFPNSDLVRSAKKKLRRINRAKKKLEKEEKERRLAAKLKTVTVQEIITAPRDYRNKTFIRNIYCDDISLSEFVTKTAVAELNLRQRKMYATRCCLDYNSSAKYPDCNGFIELRLRPDQAKKITREFKNPKPSSDRMSWQKYSIKKAKLRFRGQVDYTKPVFYLKEF